MRLSRHISQIKLQDEQFEEMVRYCQAQPDILALYLYGSYGTPYQTPLSDVDLAVLPVPGTRWDLYRELDVHSELGRIGQNDDITVVNLRAVPVTLQFRVLETGKVLYARDPELVANFAAEVVLRHADFAPDLAALYRDWDYALREEFL